MWHPLGLDSFRLGPNIYSSLYRVVLRGGDRYNRLPYFPRFANGPLPVPHHCVQGTRRATNGTDGVYFHNNWMVYGMKN